MIYLDNCATAKVHPQVAEKVMECMLQNFGNPSSLHHFGMDAYQLVGNARAQIANMIGAKTSSIVFTSSGTESNNLAILGSMYGLKKKKGSIVTTAIEHSSVLSPLKHLEEMGFKVIYIKPNPISGRIETGDITDAVNEDTILLSVMHANNETGEILPIAEIVKECKTKNPDILVHCDCVQSYGKIPVELYKMKVDLLSASGHKIGGPKGCGMLYIREGVPMEKFFFGGSQEKGIKPGTENVPGIAGFGLASELAMNNMRNNLETVKNLNRYLREKLSQMPDVIINSSKDCIPYVLNVSLPGHDSNDVITYLGMRDIYVSAGAACSSATRSHVLKAYGYNDEIVNGALRISFSTDNTTEELNVFCDAIREYIG